MVNESTITKLYEMRLSAMADSFREQLQDNSFRDLSFEERFGLVVDLEWSRRKSNKLMKLIVKLQKPLAKAGRNVAKYTGTQVNIDPFQFAIMYCTLLQQRNGFFMQIITQFSMSPQQYILQFESLQISRPEKCPNCGVSNSFHGHGCYWRNIVTDKYEERIPVVFLSTEKYATMLIENSPT